MITRDELVAALNAQGLNLGVQVSLDCVPLEIVGIDTDERTGRINLKLDEDSSFGVLRAFLSRASSEALAATRGYSVVRNARGHWCVLNAGED